MKVHCFTLKIGGYDSYELDFETVDVRSNCILTNTDGAIYIVAFKGTTNPSQFRHSPMRF
ncbi:MAG: hypothetical protein WCF90_08560 [Methanomicrobiales archaeon]